jgi:hypothetical protein
MIKLNTQSRGTARESCVVVVDPGHVLSLNNDNNRSRSERDSGPLFHPSLRLLPFYQSFPWSPAFHRVSRLAIGGEFSMPILSPTTRVMSDGLAELSNNMSRQDAIRKG